MCIIKIKQVLVLLVIAVLFFVGCDKGGDSSVAIPGEFVLTYPEENDDCLSITSIGTSSEVVFSWKKSSDAESYFLTIVNLNDQDTVVYSTTIKTYTATLSVNAPYVWNVTAINSSGETVSDSWMFYLSGVASDNYAPYLAVLSVPASGETISSDGASSISVSFSWSGNDPDGDIANYALYLDKIDASTLAIESQTETSVSLTLEGGNIYYWKVVTTDKVGNASTSSVSSFQIE